MSTFQQLYKQVQDFVGDRASDSLTKIKQWINESVVDIWSEHGWHFKRSIKRINTVAPYTTGTITVSQGSTSVTIAGGDLTGLEGYKLCSALGQPFVRISSVASGGASATLEAAWTETSLSGSTFVAYKDIYSLGTTVESVVKARLLRAGYGDLTYVTDDEADWADPLPVQTGVPETYRIAPTGSTTISIQVWPIPDAIYPIDTLVELRPTAMSDDADTPSLPDEFTSCIVALAAFKASLYDKAEQNAQIFYQDYQNKLNSVIRKHKAKASSTHYFKPADWRGNDGRYGTLRWPGSYS